MTRAALLCAVLLVAGCSTPPLAESDSHPAIASCADQGGEMKQVGRARTWQCVLSYSDAGKTCTASSQCLGDCLAADSEPPATGQAQGRCAPTSDRFGCRTVIENGVAQPTLCRD